MKSGPNCILLQVKNVVVFALFLKETVFFPPNVTGTPVQHQLAMDIWVYFWTLHYMPLVYISILMPCPPDFILSWTARLLLNPALFSTLLYSFYTGDLDFCSWIFNKCSFLTLKKKKKTGKNEKKKISFK